MLITNFIYLFIFLKSLFCWGPFLPCSKTCPQSREPFGEHYRPNGLWPNLMSDWLVHVKLRQGLSSSSLPNTIENTGDENASFMKLKGSACTVIKRKVYQSSLLALPNSHEWSTSYFSLYCQYMVNQKDSESKENHQLGDITVTII